MTRLMCLTALLHTAAAHATEPLVRDLPPWLIQSGSADDRRVAAGYLPVELYDGYVTDEGDTLSVVGDGTTDCTAGLQQAIDDARAYHLVVLVPEGTYVLSDTLNAVMAVTPTAGGGWRNAWRTSNVLMGDPRATRPVFVLADGAAGFTDSSAPRPMVAMWSQCTGNERGCDGPPDMDPNHQQDNIAFNQVFRGINLDCGAGNSGCVGLRDAAAQGSSVEHVTVFARDGYAGFWDLPARASGAIDIAVHGGQIGLLLKKQNVTTVVGLTLHDQSVTPIQNDGLAPLTVVGFDISGPAGAPLTTQAPWSSTGGSFALVDGILSVPEGATALDNAVGRTLTLRNVYVRGADAVVQSGAQPPVPRPTGEWAHVARYAFADPQTYLVHAVPVTAASWTDGQRADPEQIEVSASAAPPTNLMSRHLPPRLPFALDPDVVWATDLGVTGDGATDDGPALQAAINAHDAVFLPKGEYAIGDTLTLGSQTTLFGVARTLAMISPAPAFCPQVETAIIQTVSDPRAATQLADVWIAEDASRPACDHFQALHWRAGSRSVVRTILLKQAPWTPRATTTARHSVRVDGDGGGRFYFLHKEDTHGVQHAAYRILSIVGTREPLTFYGLNPEHAQASPFVELIDAADVAIFGVKAELTHVTTGVAPAFDLMNVTGGHDVLVTGHGLFGATEPGTALYRLTDVDDVEISNVVLTTGHPDAAVVLEQRQPTPLTVPATTRIARLQRGAVTRPVLAVTPTSLTLQVDVAGASPAALITIGNVGDGTFPWSVDCTDAPLTCTVIDAGVPGSVSVTANSGAGGPPADPVTIWVDAPGARAGHVAITVALRPAPTADTGVPDTGAPDTGAPDTATDPSAQAGCGGCRAAGRSGSPGGLAAALMGAAALLRQRRRTRPGRRLLR